MWSALSKQQNGSIAYWHKDHQSWQYCWQETKTNIIVNILITSIQGTISQREHQYGTKYHKRIRSYELMLLGETTTALSWHIEVVKDLAHQKRELTRPKSF